MRALVLQGVALALLLLALPVIVIAYQADVQALAVAGVMLVAVGALIPPVLRFLPGEDS